MVTYDRQARPDGDRFSRFLDNAETTEASLAGESKTTGARLSLYNINNTISALVLYVIPGSPAAQSGVIRGDIIAKMTVDGQAVTTDNYANLLAVGTNYVFTLGRYENAAFVSTGQTKTVVAQSLQEDPMPFDTIYTKGNKKIGYLVYNRFRRMRGELTLRRKFARASSCAVICLPFMLCTGSNSMPVSRDYREHQALNP